MKAFFVGIASFLFVITILFFPDLAFQGAAKGLLLWFNRIVPALLPCMILTQLCIHSKILEKLTKNSGQTPGRFSGLSGYGLYTALLGILCGFPMGARLVHDFYAEKKISRKEAMYLLTFCSQLSPAFLREYVFADPVGSEKLCTLLLLSYYMTVLFLWFIPRWLFRNRNAERVPGKNTMDSCSASKYTKKEATQTFCLSENLDTSIMNSLETILRIGGYIILFSVLAAILQQLPCFSEMQKSIFVSVIEITTGLEQLKTISLMPKLKGILFNSLCAFGGMSSLMQVCGVLKGSGLPVYLCFAAKACQAVLTCLVTGLLFFFVL